MMPTPAQQRVSRAFEICPPMSDSPWRPLTHESVPQTPRRWHESTEFSLSPSPPPPAPTRTPPPIPSTQPRGRAVAEKHPEPELPSHLLAQLVASLQAGKDINNLGQTSVSEEGGNGIEPQAPGLEVAQSPERFPSMPMLQKVNTHDSHHSSKNSAGHSYAFAGGRSHKASLISTASASSRRMTTEEKMSEVDEFFNFDGGDDDGGPVTAPDPATGS